MAFNSPARPWHPHCFMNAGLSLAKPKRLCSQKTLADLTGDTHPGVTAPCHSHHHVCWGRRWLCAPFNTPTSPVIPSPLTEPT